MTTYRVRHQTTYTYSAEVSASYGRGHLRPRDLPWQRLVEHSLTVDPLPTDVGEEQDAYGNPDTYFHVTTDHRRLQVTGSSVVEVERPAWDADAAARPWEEAVPTRRRDIEAMDFVLASPRVDLSEDTHAYAAVSFTPGRPLIEAVEDLSQRIHREFRYDKGATTVSSRVGDVLSARAGVCQDFAHLTVACLRSLGLAARYVSGYLATRPPPGRPRVVGADASHAWAAVWVPGGTWVHVDPTNDQFANDRYCTLAWGRDYSDVPPIRGVIFTDARESTLEVSVDVAPL